MLNKVLFKNKLAITGLFIFCALSILAIFAPLIAPYAPNDIDIDNYLTSPSRAHIMGTDQLGRDVLSRIIYGAQVSMKIGFVSVSIAVIIGIFFGSIAGYFSGKLDNLIMRFVDIMLCFPTYFLILAIVALTESNIYNIMVIIGITSWMGIARLIRAEILSLKQRDFVQVAKSFGASDFWIITRHLIPNALSPVIVSATLGVAGAILTESSLSFLGIGVQPPTASWGNMLIDAKSALGFAWWLMLYPGLAIFITVMGFNLLGEGLRQSVLSPE